VFLAGLLVCLVYLGLSVACIFGGVVLERFPSKTVLTAAIALDILCVGAFAASTSKYVSLASRFLIGIAQAFFVMYLPVWVDEYAPAGRATSWMAMTQIGSNLGIILGYVVAGMVTVHTQYSWRAPFWFQVALLLPVLLLFTSLRPQAMDVSAARGGKGTGGLGGGRAPTSALAEFPAVLGSPVFLLTSGVLSVLYFVVAGLQVWITPFLTRPPFSVPLETIVFVYSFIASSAPALGLVTGGLLVDRLGGYTDARRTVDLALVFSVVGVSAAWAALATTSLPLVALLLWVLLFCGSVVVPACVGLSLAAVAKAQRPVASSLSLLIGNLAGWFAGPLVSGFVATVMGDVQWGFRTTMMWSSLSLAFLLALRCLLPPPRRPGFAAECDDAVSVGP